MKRVYQNRAWFNDLQGKSEVWLRAGLYRPFSSYPFIVRDITVPDDTPLATIVENGGNYLEAVDHLGNYEPKHNATYRLVFQSKHRTLTSQEVERSVGEIMAAA